MILDIKNNLLAKVVICASLVVSLSAKQKIDQAELDYFASAKYKVNLAKQTKEVRDQILNDYLQTVKLSDEILKSKFKNYASYKVENRLLAVKLWAKMVLDQTKVSNQKLKELYNKFSPKTEPAYKLRNILLSDKDNADKVFNILNNEDNSFLRLNKFIQLVKSHSEDFITRKSDGDNSWMDLKNISPTAQKALSAKQPNDIVKMYVDDVGWQIIYIEAYKPARKATFAESKETLTNIAKQEALSARIKRNLR